MDGNLPARLGARLPLRMNFQYQIRPWSGFGTGILVGEDNEKVWMGLSHFVFLSAPSFLFSTFGGCN